MRQYWSMALVHEGLKANLFAKKCKIENSVNIAKKYKIENPGKKIF